MGERLATVEVLIREIRDRLERVEDSLDGGGDVAYDRSVRGRLHRIEGTLAGFVLRRSYGAGLLKGWERFALVAAGLGTMAAAWYGAIH